MFGGGSTVRLQRLVNFAISTNWFRVCENANSKRGRHERYESTMCSFYRVFNEISNSLIDLLLIEYTGNLIFILH